MLFLSHSGADTDAARELSARLQSAGVETWLDVERLQPSERWMPALEKAIEGSTAFAVYVGRSGVRRWVDREVRLALDRNVNDEAYRLFPILADGADPEDLPAFLRQHQAIRLEAGLEPEKLKELIGAILRQPPARTSLLDPNTAPYVGLRSFNVDEGLLFHGRDEQVEQLVERIRQTPFLAVIGDSGSGKSSLVKAGLVPALLAGRNGAAGGERWKVAVARPANNPFRELATALTDLDSYGQPRQTVRRLAADDLTEGTGGVRNQVESLVEPGVRTLLVIDQFEEIFPSGADKLTAEAARYVDSLLAAMHLDGDRPVHVLVTLRADFYGHCWRHQALPDLVAQNQFPVQRMGRDGMRAAIEGPLRLAGAEADDGLIDTLLQEAGDNPSSLPLLEHALELLWRRRRDNRLSFAAYEAMGRLQGALRQKAEEVYHSLSDDQKKAAEKIFVELIRPGEGVEDSRQVAPRDRVLQAVGADAAAEETLDTLIRERLLAGGSDDRAAYVDIAHEALIREWPRLREWIDLHREDRLIAIRLEAAAKEWELTPDGARHEYLYPAGRLAAAEDWSKRQPAVAPALTRFLGASAAEVRKAEQRREREQLARYNEARRTARWLQLSLGLAVVALIIGGLFFMQSQRQTELAQAARDQAEGLISFLLFDLRDKLQPIGRLDILDDVNERVETYYGSLGEGSSFEQQCQRSAALDNRGDVLSAQGRLADALGAYEASRAIAERLAAADASNAGWQRDLSVSHSKVGDALSAQGRLEDALRAYEASRAIFELLAAVDASNTDWQRGLSVSQIKVGDVLSAQGRLEDALGAYEASRAILEGLAAADASNAVWQRDLAASGSKIGEVLSAQGKLEDALGAYEASRGIAERLAAADASNAGWQRDLSVSHEQVGNVLSAQGRLEDALETYKKSRAIRERLAAADESNAVWQRDLAVSDFKIGAVEHARGNRTAARERYRAARAISARLVELDPTNAVWRNDLRVINERLAALD